MVYLVIHFVWKDKSGQGPERKNIVRLSTRKSKEKLWGVGKSVKILVLHVNTSHKAYTTRDIEQID